MNEKVKWSSRTKSDEATIFSDMHVLQTLSFHRGPIWALKFSHDGKFLCSAGADSRVVVWSTVVGQETADLHSLLADVPHRVYENHAADITDVSWSQSHFILSASCDRTIRLFHVSRDDCLQVFRHPDIVTSVAFHPDPMLDKCFVSGCFDKKIRAWDMIPESTVREWAEVSSIVTAICFSPNGKRVVGGLVNGQVIFYDYEGMKFVTQMTGSGKYSRKVSGLCYMSAESRGNESIHISSSIGDNLSEKVVPSRLSSHSIYSTEQTPSVSTSVKKSKEIADVSKRRSAAKGGTSYRTTNNSEHLLVTTNDSRVRLYRLDDYSLERKFVGARNVEGQLRASFSGDARYVICGSNDGSVVIWEANKVSRINSSNSSSSSSSGGDAGAKGKSYSVFSFFSSNPTVDRCDNYESLDCAKLGQSFSAEDSAAASVTVAIFAPASVSSAARNFSGPFSQRGTAQPEVAPKLVPLDGSKNEAMEQEKRNIERLTEANVYMIVVADTRGNIHIISK